MFKRTSKFLVYAVFFTFFLISHTLVIATDDSHVESQPDWSTYFQNTIDASNPHPTLVEALRLFDLEGRTTGFAVDLGCGTGRDTLHLLKKGWNVLAIDGEDQAIEILLDRVTPENLSQLQVMTSSFSNMILPEGVDLINASICLPFCPPEEFPAVWDHFEDSIATGGRFAGHFFGDRDEWAWIPGRTHLSEEEVLKLFENSFEIEYMNVFEEDHPCADGTMKHWHVFFVVAKKIY